MVDKNNTGVDIASSNKKRLRNQLSPETSANLSKEKQQKSVMSELVGSMTKKELSELIANVLGIKLENVATKDDIKSMEGKIYVLEQESCELNSRLKICEEAIKATKKVIEEVIYRSKVNNLIFKGLKIDGNVAEGIKQFCAEVLGLSDQIEINWARPLGNKNLLMFIAHFPRDRDIQLVLRNAHKLKGTNYFIQKDFSREYRRQRSKFFRFRKELMDKSPDIGVKVTHNYMLLNGQRFEWNDELGFVQNNLPALDVISALTGLELSLLLSIVDNLKKENENTFRSGRQKSVPTLPDDVDSLHQAQPE